MPYDYTLLHVELRSGVAFAVIDNPPVNLMTMPLFSELAAFAEEAAADDAVRALVLRSDNPDFFIAHFDVQAILEFPVEREARRAEAVQDNPFHAMCERYRTMPKVTIAEIAGRVGGGGSELALACDMRFGALGKAVINQPEVALGILPGGGGTQRLPRLLGRGRALELMLGADDLDAESAERWGYLNRALPSDQLRPFVTRLAKRIASFPAEAVASAKASALNAESDSSEALLEEGLRFQQLIRRPESRRAMQRFQALGGGRREAELRLAELCREVSEEG